MTIPTQQYRNNAGEIVNAGQVPAYRCDIPTAVEGIMQSAHPGDFIVIHADQEYEVYPPELFYALYQKI